MSVSAARGARTARAVALAACALASACGPSDPAARVWLRRCASCHGEDGRAPDGMRHDVGSRAVGDQRRELDSPSLAGLAGTAPYYHDGRFATLRELLEKSRGKMGQQRPLSAHELDALEAYLRTR